MRLHQDYDKFIKLETEIMVIGPESKNSFVKYWEKEKLPFIGLSDPSHKILKLYGQQIKLFKLGRQPAQIIINKKGLVTYVHYGHSMSDIPKNEELLKLIKTN